MRLPLLAVFALAACQGLGPPPAELEQVLITDDVQGLRRQGRVRIDSPWFGGEFKALAVERRGPRPSVRLQLFPDVGGKLLDLVARADGVTAHWVHSGEVVREREELIGFLCISLIENAAPLTWERVRAGELTEDGFLVELEPASRGLDLSVRALLDEEGRLLERRYELGMVGWTESLVPEHRISSRDFEWSFLEESTEPLPAPPEALFDLDPGEPVRP